MSAHDRIYKLYSQIKKKYYKSNNHWLNLRIIWYDYQLSYNDLIKSFNSKCKNVWLLKYKLNIMGILCLNEY